MNKLAKTLIIPAILFAVGLVTTTQFYTPTALAQNNVINVCSHKGTDGYNILGNNANSLRQKLDNDANFGPNGAYGDYDFQYIDVGDDFKKQTLLDNKCNIWLSGYEADSTYTPDELSELQSWVQETNGQVMAGCDNSNHDPVCALLNFSVTTDTDTHGFLTDTGAQNPLNCNGALGSNSKLEMDGGAGGYFSGPGVTAENVLAVHETNDVADNGKPIVVYTGNFFFTADINMIQTPTLSDGPNVTNNNDILAMNAFSALADASVGKEICSSVEPVTPTPPPTTIPAVPEQGLIDDDDNDNESSLVLEIGQQYAVPDTRGTFRYFQLTELPAQTGERATLKLCPDLQATGLVGINDIMTEAAALAEGLTATNEPCVKASTAEEPPPANETDDSGSGGVGGFCNAGLIMPLFLGMAFLTANRRRRR